MTRRSATQALALATMAIFSSAKGAAQSPKPPAVSRVAFDGASCSSPVDVNLCAVVIEADGPLPEPSTGAAKNPDRIYLDFAGVRASTSGQPRQAGSRLGVRVAVHSDAPLVTRVVIDLPAPASFTMDLSHREQGRVRLQLGNATGTTAAVAREAPRPQKRASAPAQGVARADSAYGETISAVFDALERMRADLTLLDRKSMPSADSLRTHTMQLTAARKALVFAKPPAAFAAGHAQLVSACSLAAMAFDGAAAGPGGSVPPDTASAAAGALILLDRAHAALAGVR